MIRGCVIGTEGLVTPGGARAKPCRAGGPSRRCSPPLRHGQLSSSITTPLKSRSECRPGHDYGSQGSTNQPLQKNRLHQCVIDVIVSPPKDRRQFSDGRFETTKRRRFSKPHHRLPNAIIVARQPRQIDHFAWHPLEAGLRRRADLRLFFWWKPTPWRRLNSEPWYPAQKPVLSAFVGALEKRMLDRFFNILKQKAYLPR